MAIFTVKATFPLDRVASTYFFLSRVRPSTTSWPGIQPVPGAIEILDLLLAQSGYLKLAQCFVQAGPVEIIELGPGLLTRSDT